jgi:hypothetical protein
MDEDKSYLLVFLQNFDPVKHLLEHIPAENVNQGYFDGKVLC